MYSDRRNLEILHLRRKKDCTIHAVKTKGLISCVVTAQLICAFVFATAKVWFFHDAAPMINASYQILQCSQECQNVIYHLLICLFDIYSYAKNTLVYMECTKKCTNHYQTLQVKCTLLCTPSALTVPFVLALL